MEVKNFNTYRLVKSEDLNHHGTLFAGRSAEWFVESGFIAASSFLDPHNLICLKIHGMTFLKPVKPGESVLYNSRIILAGKTSLVAYVKVMVGYTNPEVLVEGFITFVHIDDNTRPKAHGIEIIPVTEEDKRIHEIAKGLKK